MLITDAVGIDKLAAAERIAAAVRGGAGIVQLRDREAGAAALLTRARALRARVPGALLLVNDRVDVALAAGVDGVQLGAGALPAAEARRLLGPAARIGRSVHSVAEARVAVAEGADFLIVGTIHATATHPDRAPAGPALLAAVAQHVRVPIFAIGGVTAANAAECLRHGAHGVAVIRAIGDAADPEAAARALTDALEGKHVDPLPAV
jgi:thiamine-phosphate diphosphorylase